MRKNKLLLLLNILVSISIVHNSYGMYSLFRKNYKKLTTARGKKLPKRYYKKGMWNKFIYYTGLQYLKNKMNDYAYKSKPQTKQLKLSSFQLLAPGKSSLLLLNRYVLELEQNALESIRESFNFSKNEWQEIIEKIKNIREKTLDYLTAHDSTLEDFSYTHKKIPLPLKKILYSILETYNINPQRIKIVISEPSRENYTSAASIKDQNIIKLNKLILNLPLVFLQGIISHEIGHIIQADEQVYKMLFNKIEEKIGIDPKKQIGYNFFEILMEGKRFTINDEPTEYHLSQKQIIALSQIIKSMEYIADSLIASRNIDIAQSMLYTRRNFSGKVNISGFQKYWLILDRLVYSSFTHIFEKNEERVIKNEGLWDTAYKKFYPSFQEFASNFQKIMEKIWGAKTL